MVVRSLIIVALCLRTRSWLDFDCERMRGRCVELNPLGSRFIEDPLLLVAFKFAVTGASIGILYVLHQRPIAQVASWWCCFAANAAHRPVGRVSVNVCVTPRLNQQGDVVPITAFTRAARTLWLEACSDRSTRRTSTSPGLRNHRGGRWVEHC